MYLSKLSEPDKDSFDLIRCFDFNTDLGVILKSKAIVLLVNRARIR